jgi:hypothetical protein
MMPALELVGLLLSTPQQMGFDVLKRFRLRMAEGRRHDECR